MRTHVTNGFVHRLDRWLYGTVVAIACISVFSMIVLTFADVLGRHFFSAIPGASEVISVQLGFVFFAGMSIVVREGGHIVVGLLVDRYGPRARRLERTFTSVVSATVMCLITWLLLTKGAKLAESQSLSAFLGFQIAYVSYAFGVLALIATCYALPEAFAVFAKSGSLDEEPAPADRDS